MKHILLIFFILSVPAILFSQKDPENISGTSAQKELLKDLPEANITIYPVPVRDNSFSVRSEKEMSSIKITNIIGQEIFKIKYTTPQFFSKIILDSPRRGMYLVVILFSDNTRIVKKVMIEGT